MKRCDKPSLINLANYPVPKKNSKFAISESQGAKIEEGLNGRGLRATRLLAQLSADPIANFDYDTLENYCKVWLEDPAIHAVWVRDGRQLYLSLCSE